MPIFEYQNLWYAYIAALAVLGICGFFILKPIPFRWIKWNILVAVIVFLGAPLQMSDHWMTPSSIYFLFEYFFVGNTEAIQVLHQLLQQKLRHEIEDLAQHTCYEQLRDEHK